MASTRVLSPRAATSLARAERCPVHHQARFYSAPGDRSIPPAKQKYVPSAGTYPKGFVAGSAHVGVKASNTRFDDLAIVASEQPCAAAAVFTKNKFQAAPVTVSRELLKTRNGAGVRGVVVNSGCANAVTGKRGLEDARRMSAAMDHALAGRASPTADSADSTPSSLVMSTGVIGQRLPIDKILDKIPAAVATLGNEHEHWSAAARAICTTDTFPKLASRTFRLPSHPGTVFSMAGMTKGAGMIHPNMATLLGVICTDAPVSPPALQRMLGPAIETSFNSISIDGDTSTNDTIAVLANGAACTPTAPGSPVAQIPDDPASPDYAQVAAALAATASELAQLVVRDGEGATKFVTIRVQGAASRTVAHRIAASIARSPLVKTALYGRDANWGRILCATGYTDGLPDDAIRPEQMGVSFVRTAGPSKGQEFSLFDDGEPQPVDEADAAKILAEDDLEILLRLAPRGHADPANECVFWTCDFSHEYVTINGDYRT